MAGAEHVKPGRAGARASPRRANLEKQSPRLRVSARSVLTGRMAWVLRALRVDRTDGVGPPRAGPVLTGRRARALRAPGPVLTGRRTHPPLRINLVQHNGTAACIADPYCARALRRSWNLAR